MSAAENKIVEMPIKYMESDIMAFIEGRETENTKRNYERAIRYFFSCKPVEKELKHVTEEDMKVKFADVTKYKNHLRSIYAAATVNLYIAALYGLYKFINRDYPEIRPATVGVGFVDEESEGYGILTPEQAVRMSELAKQEVNGFEKSMLIRVAFTTSFRKDSLLKLQWSDIKKDGDNPIYIVTAKGRNTKNKKSKSRPISEELYFDLLKIKESKRYQKYSDNRIFHLSNDTIQELMNRLRDKMGFKAEDNIVFHSFRSVLGDYSVNVLKDLKMAQEQLDHSDINMTIKRYSKDNQNYASMPGILIEQKISDDVFDSLSREEMLALLKSQTNGALLALKMGAKKMLDEKMKMEMEVID